MALDPVLPPNPEEPLVPPQVQPPALPQLPSWQRGPTWGNAIINRAQNMPMQTAREMPLTSAAILSSGASEPAVSTALQGVHAAQGWLQQKTQLAGKPGALTSAYAKALQIQDTGTKVQAISFLRSVQNLPLEEQQLFIHVIRNPGSYMDMSNLQKLEVNAAAQRTGYGGTFGDQGYQLPTDLAGGVQIASAINAVFQGKVSLGNGNNFMQFLSDMRDISGIQLGPSGKGGIGFSVGVDKTPNMAMAQVDAFKKDPIVAMAGWSAWPLTMPGQALNDVAGNAIPATQNVPVLGTLTRYASTAAMDSMNMSMRTMNWAGGQLANGIGAGFAQAFQSSARAAGYEPSQAMYDRVKIDTGIIGSMIALHVLGVAGDEFYKAGVIPEDQLPGGVFPKGASPGDVISRTMEAKGVIGLAEHPMINLLDPIVRQLIFNFRGSSLAEMLQSKGMSAVFDTIQKIKLANPGNEAGAIDMHYMGQLRAQQVQALALTDREMMPAALQETADPTSTAFATDLQAQLDNVTQQLTGHTDRLATGNDLQSQITQLERQIQKVSAQGGDPSRLAQSLTDLQHQANSLAGTGAASQDTVSALEAKKTFLQKQMEDWSKITKDPTQVLERMPHERILHNALYSPTTKLERALHGILDPQSLWGSNATSFAERLVNNLPSRVRVFDPSKGPIQYTGKDHTGPVQVSDYNTTYVTRYMRSAGVPLAEITPIIDDLSKVQRSAEMAPIMDRMMETIGKHLSKNTPRDIRAAATTWQYTRLSDTTSSTVPVTGTDARGMPVKETQAIAYDPKTGTYLPSRPTDFLQTATLPDPQYIFEATGSIRRLMGRMSQGGRLQRWASGPSYFMRALSSLSTAAEKGPTLGMRLPAIFLRKTLEEGLGNRLLGVEHPMFTRADDLSAYIVPSKKAALGSPLRDGFSQDAGQTIAADIPSIKYTQGHLPFDTTAAEAVRQPLLDYYNDPMIRRYAQLNLDPQAMASELNGTTSSYVADSWQKDILPQLRERSQWAGMSDAEITANFLDRWKQAILDKTGGSGDLLQAIKTGHMPLAEGTAATDGIRGVDLGDASADVQARMDTIQARLEHEIDPHMIRALQVEQRNLMEEQARLESIAGGPITKQNSVSLGKERAFRQELQARFSKGDLQLPQTLRVTGKAKSYAASGGSVTEHMNDWSAQLNDFWGKRMQPLGRLDTATTRQSLYFSKAKSLMAGYVNAGMSEADAGALASVDSAKFVRDVMYNMSTRSTFQRELKNVFWFAPVTQELFYRWLYRIPAEGGWALQAPLMAAKAAVYYRLLKDMHIIQTDKGTGADVLTIPGLSHFVNTASLGTVRLPSIDELQVKDLSIITSSPFPSLSPMAAVGLERIAQQLPALRGITQTLEPFGPPVSPFPTAVIRALEFAGVNPTVLGSFSPDYLAQQYAGARDQAYRYAFVDLQQQGILPPTEAQFHMDPSKADYQDTLANEHAYAAAHTAYMDHLTAVAGSYDRGQFGLQLLSAIVSPAPITMTSPQQQEWDAFYKNTLAPEFSKQGGYTEVMKQQILDELKAHPLSMAYSVSSGRYTGKSADLGFTPTNDQQFLQLYLQGVKQHMSPDEYSQVLPAMVSQDLYLSRLNYQLHQISPTLNPATILSNWGERSQAIQAYTDEWNKYLSLNPGVKAILNRNNADLAKAYGLTNSSTTEIQQVHDVMTGLKSLSYLFNGTTGIPMSEVRTVISKLGQVYSANYPNYSTKGQTPLQAGTNWYFTKVLDPYMKKAAPIQLAITNALESGDTPTAITLINQMHALPVPGLKHGGNTYPTPEQFFYGAQTPVEQQASQINWATKPAQWLTPFQRSTVGYAKFPNQDAMWKTLSDQEAAFHASMTAQGAYPGSSAYDAAYLAMRKEQLATAAGYGVVAQNEVQLSQSSPAARLQSTGFAAHDTLLQGLINDSIAKYNQLQAAGVTPSGYSQEAMALKGQFYANLYAAMQQNTPAAQLLKKDLTTISFAIPAKGYNQRQGLALYEAVFFGQFTPGSISPQLIASYGNPAAAASASTGGVVGPSGIVGPSGAPTTAPSTAPSTGIVGPSGG